MFRSTGAIFPLTSAGLRSENANSSCRRRMVGDCNGNTPVRNRNIAVKNGNIPVGDRKAELGDRS
ncbi:MAG: hypothetical protein LBS55_12495 [Prevotellaceae bacterium]|nr:hypothetical protein [Prevotellaceae bacterium]